jgi:hypothetical protein
MKTITGMFVFGGWLLAASVAAEPLRHHLDPTDLDSVTAGGAQVTADAVANGAITLTNATTKAIARHTRRGGDVQAPGSYAYAAGGTASGGAAGPGATIDTNADATTGSDAQYTRTTKKKWTASFGGISITTAFSHTAGINGAWILGGGPDD